MVLEMAVSLGDLLDDADEVWSTFFCRCDTRTLIEHEQPMLNTWPTINASECQSDHKMKQFYQFAIVSNTKLTLQTKHSTQTRLPRN